MMELHRVIYAPLENFLWDGDSFQLGPSVWIKRCSALPDLSTLTDTLAPIERVRLKHVRHWLCFESIGREAPYPGEIENLVLLSLWLVTPTATQIPLRFYVNGGGAQGDGDAKRLLDRFMHLPDAAHNGFNDVSLQDASELFTKLPAVCAARGRLNDALLLTLTGCWDHAWQSALICHSAAAEALLTYATEGGITRRLAAAYACLTEADPLKRDAAFDEFYAVYAARSDIMHGRTHRIERDERLPTLARVQQLLRRLWRAVLSSPATIAALDGTDEERKAYFTELQLGYVPPSTARRTAPALTPPIAVEFCKLCNWVYECWATHRSIFDDNPEIESMMKAKCGDLLGRLSIITQEYSLHQMAKLHDPALQQASVNLTVEYVLIYGGWNDATTSRLQALSQRLHKLERAIRPARHKLLAHNDLTTILDERPSGAFQKDADIEYFDALQEFVNIVHDNMVGGPYPFNTIATNDAVILTSVLPGGKASH